MRVASSGLWVRVFSTPPPPSNPYVPRFTNNVTFACVPADDVALDGGFPLSDLSFPPAVLVRFAREEGVGEEALRLAYGLSLAGVYALDRERVRQGRGQPQRRCGEFHLHAVQTPAHKGGGRAGL